MVKFPGGLLRAAGILFALAALVGFIAGRWGMKPPGSGPYREMIEHWCRVYNVNPDLAAAVLEVESAGVPDAVSTSGALGLMQLMPPTAREAAGELGLEGPSGEDLFNPGLNIRLGVYYLSKLARRFGGEKEFVIAAYHAGPGRLDGWRRSRTDLSPGKVIKELAPPVTRSYVRKVLMRWERLSSRPRGPSSPPP